MPVRWSWKPRRIGAEVCAWMKPGKPAVAASAPPAGQTLQHLAPPERADPIRHH